LRRLRFCEETHRKYRYFKTMQTGATTLPQDVWELFDVSWTPEEGGLLAYLDRTLERCATWFGATGASIFLKADEPSVYQLAAKAGCDNHLPDDATVIEGQGIAGSCVQSGEPMLLGNPEDHPLLLEKGVSQRKDIGTALIVPLIVPGTGCVGVMNLSRKAGTEPFSPLDLRHADLLAKFVAMAVSNARLFTETHAVRAKLQAVIGCLGVAVVVVSGEGHVTNQNAEADRLLGSFEGGETFPGAPFELLKVLREALNEALHGRSARKRARENISGRAWSVIATAIDGGGATAAVEEVTAEEKALEDRARMKRLAEIGQMTAAVAHEIRNPLTGIRSAAQMIKESPSDSQTFAEIIEEEAIKLNELCDEFLNFAKPLSLRLMDLDLERLIRRISASHQSEFDNAGVALEIEIESGLPTIQGDELRIEQVLRNLMLNSLQATQRGGSVRVEAGMWGFAVADNGSGMKKETVDRLFTPFFTTKAKGTGLGLSNVQKIVEAHGGTISVESEPGLGTRIDVLLPQPEELRQIA
jgi:two-component system sensor histidine kinase HydH